MSLSDRPKRMEWDAWLQDCNPSQWRVRVESEVGSRPDGGPVRSTIPMPTDRDLVLAVARAFGRGTYRLVPQLRNSKQRDLEIERLGGSTVRTRSVVVGEEEMETIAKEHANAAAAAAAAPPPPGRRTRVVDDPAVLDAERDARVAEARRKQAEAEAAIRRAERADGSGDVAALRAMMQQQKPADGGMAAVLAIMQQSMQQQQTLLLSLLQSAQAREQRAIELLQQREHVTADRLPELETIERTLSMVGRVRELVARDDDAAAPGAGEPAWLAAVVDVLKPHVGTVVGRLVGAAPPAATAAAPAAALPMPAAASASPAADRVVAFVQRILGEAVVGSEPAAIADIVLDDVDLLPLAVRAHLQAGRGADAFRAARSYLPEDRRPDVDALLADDAARAWIDALAAAIANADEDPSEVAHG